MVREVGNNLEGGELYGTNGKQEPVREGGNGIEQRGLLVTDEQRKIFKDLLIPSLLLLSLPKAYRIVFCAFFAWKLRKTPFFEKNKQWKA
jgi:hypothetical protein